MRENFRKLTAYLRASRAAEIIRSLVTLKGAQGASPMRNMLYLHPQTLALSKLLAFSKQCREYHKIPIGTSTKCASSPALSGQFLPWQEKLSSGTQIGHPRSVGHIAKRWWHRCIWTQVLEAALRHFGKHKVLWGCSTCCCHETPQPGAACLPGRRSPPLCRSLVAGPPCSPPGSLPPWSDGNGCRSPCMQHIQHLLSCRTESD